MKSFTCAATYLHMIFELVGNTMAVIVNVYINSLSLLSFLVRTYFNEKCIVFDKR